MYEITFKHQGTGRYHQEYACFSSDVHAIASAPRHFFYPAWMRITRKTDSGKTFVVYEA